MEILPEFDMLLTICDSSRRLGAIHLQQLYRALRANLQPNVYVTSVASNIEQCHLAVVSKIEHNRSKRFFFYYLFFFKYLFNSITGFGRKKNFVFIVRSFQ
jgi:hypothetical protein